MGLRSITTRRPCRSPSIGVFQCDEDGSAPFSPNMVGNLAAAYDFTQPASTTSDKLRASAGGSISLCADTSGNSNVNVLALNGVDGNNASTAHSAAISIVGDFQYDIDVTMPTFVPASTMYFGAKFGAAGNRSWDFYVTNAGTLVVRWTEDGTTVKNSASTINLTALANTRHLISLRFDVDNGAVGNTVSFYLDGVLFGLPVVTAGVASIFASTAALYMGSSGSGTACLGGNIHSVKLYNGIGGTLVFSEDFSTATKLAATCTATTGQTVTINSTGATGARICGARDVVNLVAASMPTLLPWSGVNYGYLNGVSGSKFSMPDSAAVDVVSNIDLRAYIALSDWSPSSDVAVIGKFASPGDQRSYILSVGSTTGKLELRWSADGAAVITKVSTTAPTITDRAALWIRATLDVDNEATGNDVNFYTSDDGIVWLKLGFTVTTAGITNIFSSTATVEIGAILSFMVGTVYRAQIYNAIGAVGGNPLITLGPDATDATRVADYNPTRYVSGTTLSSATGETWTINGGATIVTGQCAYTDGVDDFVKSAAWSCVQPVTDYYAMSQVSWTSGDYLIDGNTANALALIQTTTTPQINLNAGSSVAANTELTLRTPAIVCIVSNGASSLVRIKRGVATTGDAGAGVPNGITIAASATPASYGNACYYKILRYSPVAHSAETQNRIIAALARELRIPLT